MTQISQAFVLGAGLGTRLRPLTSDLPKPLVPIFQKPLITFAFDQLIDAGVKTIFVNTHHRPERFQEVFPKSTYRDRSLDFRHEPELLETAGGIANIAGSLGEEPLLVYNGDVLTDLPVTRLIDAHFRAGNIVTLALRSGGGPKHIAFDSGTGVIVDIRNQAGSDVPPHFVFSGLYIIDPEFVRWLQPGVKRSVIPIFLELIRQKKKVGGVVIDEGNWWDVGNREAYLQLHRDLEHSSFPAYPVGDRDWKSRVHPEAIVDSTAELRGCSVVGAQCRVGAAAKLEDTILWQGAQIASRSDLRRCIVRSFQNVAGAQHDLDI